MNSRVTMRDVARKVGVSPMTVSRALRDDETVNEKTRQNIRNAARELGYVYDTTAQAFRTNRSGFVALTLPSLDNANFAATYRDLSDGLAETSLQLLLGSTNYQLAQEEALVQQLLARNPEAIILTGGYHTDDTRALLRRREIPVIEIWDLPKQPLGHVIGFSNAAAMATVIEHLSKTGRRNFAFVGAAPGADQRGFERRQGAEEAAKQLGLPQVDFVECGAAPISMRQGEEAVRNLGKQILRYEALVCVSDPIAFGCLCACRRLGISVPDDIAITGFGDFEVAKVSSPQITTVNVNAGMIGTRAAGLLRQLLFGSSSRTSPCVHDVGFHLVTGETS